MGVGLKLLFAAWPSLGLQVLGSLVAVRGCVQMRPSFESLRLAAVTHSRQARSLFLSKPTSDSSFGF
jgi:hypothetical protein